MKHYVKLFNKVQRCNLKLHKKAALNKAAPIL